MAKNKALITVEEKQLLENRARRAKIQHILRLISESVVYWNVSNTVLSVLNTKLNYRLVDNVGADFDHLFKTCEAEYPPQVTQNFYRTLLSPEKADETLGPRFTTIGELQDTIKFRYLSKMTLDELDVIITNGGKFKKNFMKLLIKHAGSELRHHEVLVIRSDKNLASLFNEYSALSWNLDPSSITGDRLTKYVTRQALATFRLRGYCRMTEHGPCRVMTSELEKVIRLPFAGVRALAAFGQKFSSDYPGARVHAVGDRFASGKHPVLHGGQISLVRTDEIEESDWFLYVDNTTSPAPAYGEICN